jgi:pyrimidine-nucleoside phosphorylase
VAVLSDMGEPLGRAVGNALEVREAVETLQGQGPPDLLELCLVLGAEVLIAAGAAASLEEARARLAATVPSGGALEALLGLVERLGGDPRSLLRPDGLPTAPVVLDLPAPRDGYVAGVDALACGRVAIALGAGRAKKGDVIDPAVGLVLRARRGDRVGRGEPLATVHARTPLSVDSEPARRLLAAFSFSDAPPPASPLVIGTVH